MKQYDHKSWKGQDEPLPRIKSSRLFGNSSCLVIEHGHKEYHLRITRLGKLILTK